MSQQYVAIGQFSRTSLVSITVDSPPYARPSYDTALHLSAMICSSPEARLDGQMLQSRFTDIDRNALHLLLALRVMLIEIIVTEAVRYGSRSGDIRRAPLDMVVTEFAL